MSAGIVVRALLSLVVGVIAAPGVTAAWQDVYKVPQSPRCDQAVASTSEPVRAEAEFLAAISRQPEVVTSYLDLARCSYKLRPPTARIQELLGRALSLVQDERRRTPAPPQTSTPLRVAGSSPAKIKDAPLEYSDTARYARITGLVFIDALIDAKGDVREARVVGSNPQFDKAARAAVLKWKYEPTIVADRPVPVTKLVVLKFSPNPELTPIDSIDIARFHYSRQEHAEVEAALEQAAAMVRDEIALWAEGERNAAAARNAPSTIRIPTVLQQVDPSYTRKAMEGKIQGDVSIHGLVLPDGTVRDLRITRSLDGQYGLDYQAVRAVKSWRFSPARDASGNAVPMAIDVMMDFKLH